MGLFTKRNTTKEVIDVDLSQLGYDIFKIYVDSPAVPRKGKREVNFVATCRSSSSGVVRVPQRYFRGQGRDGTRFFILAEAYPQWVAKSRQSVVISALAQFREFQQK